MDMLTVAIVYLPVGQGIYLGDGQDQILPETPWRTMISLLDSVKWRAKHFRPVLRQKVMAESQGWGTLNLLHMLDQGPGSVSHMVNGAWWDHGTESQEVVDGVERVYVQPIVESDE